MAAAWRTRGQLPGASRGQRHLGCCLRPCYQLPLATFNLKYFKDFAGYYGLPLLEP
jgi:hypothetical protein